MLRHREGSLMDAPDELGSNREGRLEEAVLHLADERADEPPHRLLVAGQGTEETLDRADQSLPFEGTPQAGIPHFEEAAGPPPPTREVSSAPGAGRQGEPSEEDRAEATPALAFAVKALYLDADSINFLTEDERHTARDREDRQEVMQAGVLGGGLLALLLFLVTGLQMYFERQASQAEQQLAQLDQQLTRVEEAREERDRLRRQLRKSRALVVERTHAASLMDHVGQALPRGLWLDALEIARVERDSASVRTAGFAVPEASVASYLSRLEQRPQLDQVRLRYSRVLSAEDVFQRTGTHRQMLRRFEVRFVQTSRGTTDPETRQSSIETR